MTRRSCTATIAHAMRVLSADIKTDDGVANAALIEAAERLDELHGLLREAEQMNSQLRVWPRRFSACVRRALKEPK